MVSGTPPGAISLFKKRTQKAHTRQEKMHFLHAKMLDTHADVWYYIGALQRQQVA